MLHEAQILINWVFLHKEALLQLVGGAAGLTTVAQVVLHKLKVKWNVNSKAFSYTLVQILTLVAALVAYLADNANFAVVYPWLATAVATLHRYLVSPYYTKTILPYLEFQASKNATIALPQAAPAAPVQPESTAVPSFVS